MEKSQVLFLSLVVNVLLFLFPIIFESGLVVNAEGTPDGSETWGYVDVRPEAHMFWWLYKSPYRVEDPSKPWPIILWLQGGPGSSGVGMGNFQEIGPLDTFLEPRNSTWLKKADLLFVDSPVGTGYSYVEDPNKLASTEEIAIQDLTKLLIEVFKKNESLQKSPLYIVAESYGGKHAVALALSALQAIEDGQLSLKLGGIALGDSWISAEDYIMSWGPLLNDVSRLDEVGLAKANGIANKAKEQISALKFVDAFNSWNELENVIFDNSNDVDFYNFMLDNWMDPLIISSTPSNSSSILDGNLTRLMNDEIKKKLKIIPPNLTWVLSSDTVFNLSANEFMKPSIQEVDLLLTKGVNVAIYNGQLDLICSTKGTEAWVQKLQWAELPTFLKMARTPIYCADDKATKGFFKSHKNLQFYWILDASHYVPVDQPNVALSMIGNITQSPAISKIC